MNLLFSRLLILAVAVVGLIHPAYGQTKATTTLSIAEESHSKSSKKWTGSLISSSRYLGYEEGVEEEQLVQLSLSPRVSAQLAPWLDIKAQASVNLNSGRVQSRFADNSTNSLSLDKLEFTLNPWGPFYFKAGAIDQSFLGTELLINARAFPGAIAGVSHQWKKINFNVSAQQAIPTSVSLESDRREDEDEASFNTAGLKTQWTPLSGLKLTANLNYFQFKDLPSVVARDSQLWGNQVNGEFNGENIFLYDFEGLAQVYSISYQALPWVRPYAELQIVENNKAPSQSNRGQWIGAGAQFNFKGLDLTPFAAHFYSEANSSPAVYNSAIMGHNNREGMLYKLKADFKKYGFFVEGQYVQADLIDPNPVQRDMNSVSFIVGIANELF